jgi:hypothetical protein
LKNYLQIYFFFNLYYSGLQEQRQKEQGLSLLFLSFHLLSAHKKNPPALRPSSNETPFYLEPESLWLGESPASVPTCEAIFLFLISSSLSTFNFFVPPVQLLADFIAYLRQEDKRLFG